MKTRKAILSFLILFFAAIIMSGPIQVRADDNPAKSILKNMSDYVGSLQAIELSFDSSIEIITPQLEKIQFTDSGEALLRRPNMLRVHRLGGYADVLMNFDGKSVSIYGKHNNRYAQFEAPGSIDDLIQILREGHGVALPGADLLLIDSYKVLLADVMEAKYIGRGVINGYECEHLAFRNFKTDWQLWVQVGAKSIPRKMVVTSKTMNSAPQYTVSIKSWKTDVEPEAGVFSFTPPSDAKRIKEAELMEFDELPPGAPRGDEK